MCDTAGHDHGHHHHHHFPTDADQFRVVLTGKGGVGKTSLTALLARLLARDLYQVLALDSDPQMNLPFALGVPRAEAKRLVPLSKNPAYVEEKTGARPGSGYGLMFRLNPNVSDVVERFGVVGPDGVNLLIMGTLVQPAAGCLCPENSLLSAVIDSLKLRRGEAILLDTQAGVEHFGRALAKGFRHAAVVTDPTFNGVSVALQAARLAHEIGIGSVHLLVNRVRSPADVDKVYRLIEEEGGFPFASRHALPWDETLLESEPAVEALLGGPPTPLVAAVSRFRDALTQSEKVICAS
ncbi:MAG: AAA family ATPase [Myxococcales bacterium]|nr:AAA family ATPase [Myxococcales bacterium]MCB9583686.1 AAA family ATPase [Polyangiaceae bacterium]